MWKIVVAGLTILSLSACTHKSAYEAAVEDEEPRYFYKSLAGLTCYEKFNHRDEKRLVNYYGPTHALRKTGSSSITKMNCARYGQLLV